MKRAVIAGLAILVFGGARLPYERHLAELQNAAGFRTTKLDLSLREQLGQMGFVASLSGFRSLIAAYLFLEAYDAWTTPIGETGQQWSRMANLLSTITTLQPKSETYWDMAAWHMAYNASVAALEDETQPSEPLRKRAQKQYWELGRKFIEDGIANNPRSSKLYATLARILVDKFEDHCAAADAYAKAADCPGALPYLRRAAAYELAKCEGREREAYQALLDLYKRGESERTPSVIASIKRLEDKLGIPPEQRIKEPDAQ